MSVSHRVDSVKEHAEKRQREADLTAASEIAFVVLAEAEQIDAATATEHVALFSEWAYSVNYTVGQLRRYKGKLYKCVTAHTSQADWTPDTAASLWATTLSKQDFSFSYSCNYKQNTSGCLQKNGPLSQVFSPVPQVCISKMS